MKLKLYPLQSGLPVCSLTTLRWEGGRGGRGCVTDSFTIPQMSNIVSCSLTEISLKVLRSLSLSLSLTTLNLLPYSLSHGYQTPVPFCLKPVLSDLLYSCTIISQIGTQFVPKLFASSFSNVSQTCTQYFFLNIYQLRSSFSNTSQKLTQFFLIYILNKNTVHSQTHFSYYRLSQTFLLHRSFSNISQFFVFSNISHT